MDLRGFEPLASALRTRRSTSWAISPSHPYILPQFLPLVKHKFFMLIIFFKYDIMTRRWILRIWRNWQTRMVQVHVNASSCRFNSCYPHQVAHGCKSRTFSFRVPVGHPYRVAHGCKLRTKINEIIFIYARTFSFRAPVGHPYHFLVSTNTDIFRISEILLQFSAAPDIFYYAVTESRMHLLDTGFWRTFIMYNININIIIFLWL